MKNIFSLVLIFIILTSCSDDAEPKKKPITPIVKQPEIIEVPISAQIGSEIVIKCLNVGTGVGDNIVYINNVPAGVIRVMLGSSAGDPTLYQLITISVPVAETGKIKVTYNGMSVTSEQDIEISPYITNMAPKGGPTGTQVVFTGINFSPVTEVKIGGEVATILNKTSTSLTVRTTGVSRFGNVFLYTPNSLGVVPNYFMGTEFTQTPGAGTVGTWVFIYTSPHPSADRPTVRFNGVQALEVDYSAGVKARVPEGATTGKITLEWFGITSTSTHNFTVQ